MLFPKFSSRECFILLSSIVLTTINRSEQDSGINDKKTKDDWKDPDVSSPHECTRICKKGEAKICYFHFTVEIYTTLGGACSICTPNENNTGSCQCVLGDGYEKGILTVNRQIPGPSIQVCEGDKVIIDVANKMEGLELAIHWHGILQKGTPWYDGVPGLTQCAIRQSTTFRYRMLASPGTHWWHAHTGLQKGDGLYGSFIVRQCPEDDPHFKLYDHDYTSHVIVIADLYHPFIMEKYPGLILNNSLQSVDNVLINGKGQHTDSKTGFKTNTPLEVFRVTSGKKYRMRLISAFAGTCQAQITIQGHSLTVIATDGQPCKPVVVETIVFLTGERYDFVLKADQPIGAYWIQVKGIGPSDCFFTQPQQLAVLRYGSGPAMPSTPAPTYEKALPIGVILNPIDAICPGPGLGNICINQLKSAKKVPKEILKEVPDVKLFFLLSFYPYTPMQAFEPGTYKNYLTNGLFSISTLNGISYTAPSCPPLSQSADIPPGTFCNSLKGPPKNCGLPCICTHKVDVPLNAIVEITVCDGGVFPPGLSHPFHLHGHVFYVLNQGLVSEFSPGLNFKNMSMKDIEDLDGHGLFGSKFDSPPGKDTLQVPTYGCARFRFKADNPGHWFFHCHYLFHLVTGMATIIHVGEKSDLPPIPKDFPRCGDFLPPFEGKDDW